ncbi:MAG: alanyl-tRNA editing protein [Thermoanaerobaculia bacterium]
MTRVPAYERDPYLTDLEVEITGAGEAGGRPFAVLDDTLCYPEGGGQPADHGRLGDIAIVDTRKAEGVIRHFLERPIQAGPATLRLDWRRRYDHMQQHTSQHLLSALALERFGWATRSFHLGPETSDIELDAPNPSDCELEALEDAVTAEIRGARPVTTRRVTTEEYGRLDVRSRGLPAGHSGDIRLVEIEGIDLNTCGGTHLRSTAEIETIKVVDTERIRGGSRVRWLAGHRVRRRLGALEARASELRRLLDSDDAGLVEVASLKLDQLSNARRRVRHLEGLLAEARVAALAAGKEPVASAHFDGANGGLLQQIARSLVAQAPAKACLLTATGSKGSFFLVGAGADSPVDAAEVGPRVAEILEGRGGGSGGIFQGKAGSLADRAEAESLLRTEAIVDSGDSSKAPTIS